VNARDGEGKSLGLWIMKLAEKVDDMTDGPLWSARFAGSDAAKIASFIKQADVSSCPTRYHLCKCREERCRLEHIEGVTQVHVDQWRLRRRGPLAESWCDQRALAGDSVGGVTGKGRGAGGISALMGLSAAEATGDHGAPGASSANRVEELRSRLQGARERYRDGKEARGGGDGKVDGARADDGRGVGFERRGQAREGDRKVASSGHSGVAEVLGNRVADFDRRHRGRSRDRRRKSKRRRRDDDYSSSEGSGDSRGGDCELVFRGAGSGSSSSLAAKSRRAPGKILEAVLTKMQSFLAARSDVEVRSGKLTPIVTSYLTSVLQPALGKDFHARNRQEMRTIAEAVDALLIGDLARASDILISRFSAVELASTSKHWNVARHLELIPPQDVSSIPTELMDYATGAQKKEARGRQARTSSY